MLHFPPISSWDALHPLIIHMPIGLLLFAPVFIIIGALLKPERGRPYLIAALIAMLLGTASVFVAVQTGEAAGKLAERTPEIKAVLEHHENLAEATQVGFSVLTVIFAAILYVPRLLRRASNRMAVTVLPLIFLMFYGAGMLLLANTAHNGGRLVHEFGVRAMVAPYRCPRTRQVKIVTSPLQPLEP